MIEDISNLSVALEFAIRYSGLFAVIGGTTGLVIARKKFQNKKEKRLFSNIQRPVALIPSGKDKLELEKELLDAIDFFDVDCLTPDIRSLDTVTEKYRLAVVRYENTDRFWKIYDALIARTIPLIIYSRPGEIEPEQIKKIQSKYTRYTLCNTPVRLVSDVFAIMSVYPEGVR